MRQPNLKVDMAIRQSIRTSFIQKINIFYQQTEEGNNNLRKDKGSYRKH